ncbi:hypothetical protein [Modestobacter versicolor]|uniref:DUF5642 domain-containing protein n=1 Tax=Modestobacter versicolor TaxID=429133 RepID=A0A323VQF6_9ACTN|nr:hypothetical protein [Modestobacter versicolor]MBB3674482.1 hypothetical protein [Modestobacter versicolor]PZA21548.1 hypothetical protein DMO24_09660 [Modestobacter versicolor]
MITTARRRQLGLLSAGLLGAAALAGCGSEVAGDASEGTPSSSAGSSSAGGSTGALDDVEDLSAGLLPADAFGAGAQATPITADQLEGQTQLGIGTEDLTITPESCAPAVKSVQPGLEDIEGLGAQTVTVGSGATVQVLASGEGITEGVDQLAGTVDSCPEATISSPEIGTATVTFAALEVPDVGDGSAGLTMTVSIPGPGGQPVTVPVLLGMARDGDRLVSLTSTDPTGALDAAAFADLFQQAYDHQADALD